MIADCDPAAAARAFFETVAHRCQVVDGSTSRASPGLWLLDEAIPHENPWPRRFPFRKSFYTLDDDPDRVSGAVRDWLDDPAEGHVLNVFCDDPEAEAARWEAAGYRLSWGYDLFARAVPTDEPAADLPPGYAVTRVASPELVAAINARDPEYPSSPATLHDDAFFEVAILSGSGPVAKGEIVLHGDLAHVMGMVTVPDERRRGLGRRVMHELLREAGRRGARFAVLNASLEAARFDFYPRLGFAPVHRCARLIPG